MTIEKVIFPSKILSLAFSNPWVGFCIAIGIVVCAALIVAHNYIKHYRPMGLALDQRLAATQIIADQRSDEEAHLAFVEHQDAIEAAMLADGRGSDGLRHAWVQFSETFVDKSKSPVQATTRPEGYFLHLGDDTRVLAWWANIFVALGLTFTFLGIIGALTTAVDSMSQNSGDMAKMQGALMNLLIITSAKFWTSVGGVIASIVLRWVDRRWHSKTDRKLAQLCDRLEYGTMFSPPQRFAALQLRELEQQSVALTDFSQQLAASIGDALGQHMQPVVAGLGGIQASLNEFKDGSFSQIGTQLGEAIRDNAGAEMQALAAALTTMTSGIQGVNDRLEGASGQASDQIESAARQFAAASEAMTTAFATLNSNINSMADKLTKQAEDAEGRFADRVREEQETYKINADNQRKSIDDMVQKLGDSSSTASKAMVDAVTEAVTGALSGITGATAGIQSTFAEMKTQIADMGEKLSGSAGDAAERNAKVLEDAARALADATAKTKTAMDESLRISIEESGKASSDAIARAFAAFGERFEEASRGLVDMLGATASRIETLASALGRSASASGEHADKLAEAGREAGQLGTLLGKAANDVSVAAGPIRDATQAIRASVDQSQQLLQRVDESNARHTRLMEGVAETINANASALDATGKAAESAWDSYRERFEGVDEALEKALNQIKNASSEHASELNSQVGRMDSALAEAVDRLASALDDIKDLADALEDVRGRAVEAAE